jgi:hypothetical protein
MESEFHLYFLNCLAGVLIGVENDFYLPDWGDDFIEG